jgi:hypothetical protein
MGSPGVVTRQALENVLRQEFPNGHPRFVELSVDEMKLHSDKNHDYAAGGDPLGNFKRMAVMLAQYPGLNLSDPAVVALVCAVKQIDACLWLKSNGHNANFEGVAERLMDIAVYAKLARILEDEAHRNMGVEHA